MNLLWKLCHDNVTNRAAKQENFVTNATGQTLYIRGVIAEGFDANAGDVIASLNKADTSQVLNIRFNTPGGDVFVGKEIAAAIRNYAGKTVGFVDSLCASAGTSVAIACDEIVMSKGAFWMVHNAQGMAFGDKTAMRNRADLVEKIEMSIVDDYTGKTGKPAEEIIAMMEKETWLSADEALANGFVDRIAGESDKTSNTWNLAAYANAPAALAAPPVPEPAPAPTNIAPSEPEPTPEPAHAPVNIIPEPCMTQANKNRLAVAMAT
jgi:ATP-dependent Clp protease protease subunit